MSARPAGERGRVRGSRARVEQLAACPRRLGERDRACDVERVAVARPDDVDHHELALAGHAVEGGRPAGRPLAPLARVDAQVTDVIGARA